MTVFGGMFAATAVGILFIPVLYVFFQRMREWDWRAEAQPPEARPPEARPPEARHVKTPAHTAAE